MAIFTMSMVATENNLDQTTNILDTNLLFTLIFFASQSIDAFDKIKGPIYMIQL